MADIFGHLSVDALISDRFPASKEMIASIPPAVFTTISGSHLYGFSSPDSDLDLRGAHLTPLREVISLDRPKETIEAMRGEDPAKVDLVSHDLGKCMRLLLNHNGYILEQVHSPLRVVWTSAAEQLFELSRGCITSHSWRHFMGFVDNEWRDFQGKRKGRIKTLLYMIRILMTGIHLMETGDVVSNLGSLLAIYDYPMVQDLIDRKASGGEQDQLLNEELMAFYSGLVFGFRARLMESGETTKLPDHNPPGLRESMNDLLVSTRLSPSGIGGISKTIDNAYPL